MALNLYWSPPDIQLRNGIIISFTYYCTESGTTDILVMDTVTTTDAVVYSPSFKPYTNYTCFVNASTIVGSGPTTFAIGITAEDGIIIMEFTYIVFLLVPGPVSSFIVLPTSDIGLYMTWNPPFVSNGVITNYTVIVRSYGDDTINQIIVTDESTQIINGLSNKLIIFVVQ